MQLRNLRRTLLHHLAKFPTIFEALLELTGRAAQDKRAFLHLVRRGDIIFDVGANIGNYTIFFSDIAGHNGRVYAFEPVPPTFTILIERLRVDGRYKNVVANSFACSDEPDTTVSITVPGGDLGQSSMRSHNVGSWATAATTETFLVPARRLDDYASELGLSRLDFLKCDAEGAELLVLRGASNLLKKLKPLLFLEFADFWVRDFGYSSDDLVDFLEDAGYTDFMVERKRVPLARLRAELAQVAKEDSVNLVCACPENAARL